MVAGAGWTRQDLRETAPAASLPPCLRPQGCWAVSLPLGASCGAAVGTVSTSERAQSVRIISGEKGYFEVLCADTVEQGRAWEGLLRTSGVRGLRRSWDDLFAANVSSERAPVLSAIGSRALSFPPISRCVVCRVGEGAATFTRTCKDRWSGKQCL